MYWTSQRARVATIVKTGDLVVDRGTKTVKVNGERVSLQQPSAIVIPFRKPVAD